jgi:UDP-2,3-diacylglucosamine hydrolase
MSRTLFISDLHLDPARPEIIAAFEQFLRDHAAGCEALYILGDFFEAWIGDDAPNPLADQIAAWLKALSDTGSKIYLMHGNRDFLIGDAFAAKAGATLLADPTLISLYGEDVLLLHGDILCTRDTDYMAFREQIRHPAMIEQLLAKPIEERLAIAKQLREQSKEAGSNKAMDIMDVTPEEVVRLLEENRCQHMIHGHTHRPAMHKLELSDGKAQRTVLGDWDQKYWYLEASPFGQLLQSVPIEAD